MFEDAGDSSAGLSAAGDAERVAAFVRKHRISNVTHDSREATGGGVLFVCVPGSQTDGHDHAAAAVESGATALICERALPLDVPQLVVLNARASLADAAATVWGQPAKGLTMVGVTGTAGKTTVTHLIGEALEYNGVSATVIGTLSGARTTPESSELHRRLAWELDGGTESVVMEVSSHALDLERVRGVAFDVTAFTNLGHDHLDFHSTMEAYYGAKRRLFEPDHTRLAVVCVDDEWGRRLAAEIGHSVPLLTCETTDATAAALTAQGSSFVWGAERLRVSSPLIGRYNLTNMVIAATTLSALGLDDSSIVAGLSSASPVPGRLEVVPGGRSVVVDYAHKPEALVAALRSVRELTRGRLILVVGAGGDRDKSKRSLMGAAAAEYADVVYFTSDNPRTEDPEAIIADIIGGAGNGTAEISIESDRRQAIAQAIGAAGPDDLVLIAGKGHETTQTIGTERFEFDDRVVARQILEHTP
jgi:UDP-N-acetylmuramoyl-L-alanyl-D-glutamate--2,6-diaminopimelate ligase